MLDFMDKIQPIKIYSLQQSVLRLKVKDLLTANKMLEKIHKASPILKCKSIKMFCILFILAPRLLAKENCPSGKLEMPLALVLRSVEKTFYVALTDLATSCK